LNSIRLRGVIYCIVSQYSVIDTYYRTTMSAHVVRVRQKMIYTHFMI